MVQKEDNKKEVDPYTSLRVHKSTVKRLSDYKVHDDQSYENVIKDILAIRDKLELKRRERSNAA